MTNKDNNKEHSLIPRSFWPFSYEHSPFALVDSDFWTGDFAKSSGLSVSEDKSHVYVEAALPGLKSDNIEVSFEKGVLWVKGEKKEEEKDKEKKFYRKASSSFSYRVAIPGQIDEKKEPEAVYKDGVMRVTFAKAQVSQPKKIQIKSK
ncbi:MAG: Hsp20/alpha crystallin family protein [Chlamydiales bacterium]|nr:Hsp20/alpha crystallin family protein [Chlamydiales bacterium]